MPPIRGRERRILLALGLLAAITLAVGIVLGIPLTAWFGGWFGILSTLAFFYLLWRFVRAHERIAAALESREG